MFNKKNTVFLGILSMLVILILVSGCQKNKIYDLSLNSNEKIVEEVTQPAEDELIGGDTDEYGCLVAAGYSWCQTKDKCLRTWEEPCEFVELKKEVVINFEDLQWKKYSNKLLGYTMDYPTIVNVMGNDLDQYVEFTGPLSNNEWWPRISISHYSNEFYHPGANVEVTDWVKPFPSYTLGEEISIAGLKTVHYVQAKSPQAWASDYFYFIKDNQLYNITIIHSNDQQNGQLYNYMLDSFVFNDGEAIE